VTGETHITLAHGNGGRFMRELIEEVVARALGEAGPDTDLDAAPLELASGATPMVTTDGFTVLPLEFPGGDIGSLAVNGTVNDLAVSGAVPKYLTCGFILEEGLDMAALERIVASFAAAARAVPVEVVAGDTKVVPRGQGSGLYITTTGIGLRPDGVRLGMALIRPGDAVLVSGTVGDHGVSVMLAREEFDLKGNVRSDCAAVTPLTLPLATNPAVRFMRDPTRGGLATVAHEIARATGYEVCLSEPAIPVLESVRGVCDMLGYDPYYLACEGRVVAVVAPEAAEEVLSIWRADENGAGAARIGTIGEDGGRVRLETELGGTRYLEELEDDPLPRIC